LTQLHETRERERERRNEKENHRQKTKRKIENEKICFFFFSLLFSSLSYPLFKVSFHCCSDHRNATVNNFNLALEGFGLKKRKKTRTGRKEGRKKGRKEGRGKKEENHEGEERARGKDNEGRPLLLLF
jgi:hypothetical protein